MRCLRALASDGGPNRGRKPADDGVAVAPGIGNFIGQG